MPAPRPTQQAIERAIKAALACGLSVAGVQTRPDGTVSILAPEDVARLRSPEDVQREEQACDDAFGGPSR